jgi:SAM-dependent methyltransferase
MAITRHIAELLLIEHRFKPITGKVLLLGRQEIFLTPDEAVALVRKHGIEPIGRPELSDFGHGKKRGYVSDRSFFSLFTDASVVASDVTDREGADLLFDLSGELPITVMDGFDFIYNGSVLDNVFDPAACIRNVSRMLRTDGRVLGYEGMTHRRTSFAYTRLSPEWFFDYYAINGFADVQCYVATYKDVHADPWKLYEWSPYFEGHFAGDLMVELDTVSIVVAQKAAQSTTDRSPLQNYYRPDQAPYQQAAARFGASQRREHYRNLLPRRRSWFAEKLPRGFRASAPIGGRRQGEVFD